MNDFIYFLIPLIFEFLAFFNLVYNHEKKYMKDDIAIAIAWVSLFFAIFCVIRRF